MIEERLKEYKLIESIKIQEGTLSIWNSPATGDTAWDEFLMNTTLGQFQQSSMWAQVKEVEGWKCMRIVATIDEKIVGGFQILWRQTRLGRIGYISKGPVAVPETRNMIERLVVLICDQARKHKILALIVQPPDDSQLTSDILERHQFIKSNPMDVIETTWIVDVQNGRELIEKGMSESVRRQIRLSKKSNLIIRDGSKQDIALFFQLMSSTCARQRTKPNPSSEKALGQLWRTFGRYGCLRVTLAEYDHEAHAGILNIVFGDKVTVWKKGWNFKHAEFFPNHLLYYDTLLWASSHGYTNCDFVGINPAIADAVLNGKPLSETQQKSRDNFVMRFGGMPKLLPPARIWFNNSYVRISYENILLRFGLMSVLKKIY